MGNIEKLKNKLSQIHVNMYNIVQKAFIENDTIAEDMIISQLKEGKRGDGEYLPDYSPVSVQVYGKPPGPIKLFDQGGFYKGIELNAGKTSADIKGKDYKTSYLERMYGKEIIQLNESNKSEYINDYIVDTIRDIIKKDLL